MSWDSDAVILNNKLNLFSERSCKKCDHRFCASIAGRVLEQLAQNKNHPLFIRIDGVVQPFRFYPNAALDQ